MTRDTREPIAPGITKVTSARTGRVSYAVRWSVITPAGQRVPGHATLPSLKAARAHKARMEAAKADGRYQAPSRETLEAYAVRWFARMERDWETSTTYLRRRQYAVHIGPRFGRRKVGEITRPMCQDFADELAGRYAAETVNNILSLLRGILGAAMREELIARNPADALDQPAIPRHEHASWSEGQVTRFLDATADHVDHALYVLILATGCRIGEALALTWGMVDLDAGTAEIAATLRMTVTGGKAPAPGAKTDASERTVPLSPAVVAALRAHQARQGEQRRQSARWDLRGYVFTGAFDGRALSYNTACKRLQTVQATLGDGWPRLTFHDMRHLLAARLARHQVHPAVVRDLLGHRTTQMTLDRYTATDLADRAAAVDGLEGATTWGASEGQNRGAV